MAIRIYGNRSLQTLPATRPTTAKVRQAVFNILQGQIAGSRWLDLCAGAGTMGAEALCRGAEFVAGVELSGSACRVLQANWTKVSSPDRFQVIRGDVRQVLNQWTPDAPFDWIYFDPPYEAELYEPVFLCLPPFLRDTGRVIAEHRYSSPLPNSLGGLNQVDYRHYGETGVSFYRSTQGE